MDFAENVFVAVLQSLHCLSCILHVSESVTGGAANAARRNVLSSLSQCDFSGK